ncbi:DUF1810 domain-containing protein [Flavobacterium sp. RSSA_27]|uniref:DUF1810 domain-containing protein n=1 Tax=Flavobacterium sp. RSSA_27 TaxID=3447667 RepID=UPI003F3384CA
MEQELNRFIKAQENAYEQALSEIKSGRKRSHWMWFIFPQYKGLGFSETSKYYAINNLDEAKCYLNHPILGDRLKLLTKELLALNENNATKVFGKPDDLKLKSSMTLFAAIDASQENIFKAVLDKFFNGQTDYKTLTLIKE